MILIIGSANNQWEQVGESMDIIKLKWEIELAINQHIIVLQFNKKFIINLLFKLIIIYIF